jgi:phosphatidate cytidylyltransferase
MLGVLALGSVIRYVAVRSANPEVASRRRASLKTWWVLALLLTLAIGCGRIGVAVLLLVSSILALREFTRLTGLDRSDRTGVAVVSGGAAVYIGLLAFGSDPGGMPVAILLVLGAVRVLSGQTQNYLRSVAGLFWGWTVLVYAPAHALRLYLLPERALGDAGPGGACLSLLILTASNDIAQALIGRRIGRHRIVPTVSPRKTGEGLSGGVAVTAMLGAALLPGLTAVGQIVAAAPPFLSRLPPVLVCAILGALLAVCGFLGDVNLSAIKREAGVKDGSRLLPGQGGMIDRIDSLTFTAPVFYYSLRWLCER